MESYSIPLLDAYLYHKKQVNLHGLTITLNSNELMLHKRSNEEKPWYGFHIERGKGSMVGEHWVNNKLHLNQQVQLHNKLIILSPKLQIYLGNLGMPGQPPPPQIILSTCKRNSFFS